MAQLDISTPLKDVLVAIDKKAARANADRDTLESILIGKSVNVVPGSKLSVLIEKVREEINTRKKVATGSLTIGKTYSRPDSGNINRNVYIANVTNLDFKPSKVYFYTIPPLGAIYEEILICYLDLDINSNYSYITYTDNQYMLFHKYNITQETLFKGGFKIPVCFGGDSPKKITVKWIAVE
ncbi:hypothetical protein [Romboutsia sp. 1001713B170131_170501_G6]|uniref:hypothetical protein n=1 Tax=Romboutsia sp. 1001713B170131_170501_G6 TaxID=2787108 RepID=UPI0018AC6F90|nr:hypothetical protein [Romboutsia sp. 1001713B170131_170501_G6]